LRLSYSTDDNFNASCKPFLGGLPILHWKRSQNVDIPTKPYMKKISLVLAGISALPVLAQSTAKDIYVNGVIGAVSVAGLILLVGIYRFGKYLVFKSKSIVPVRVPDTRTETVNSLSSTANKTFVDSSKSRIETAEPVPSTVRQVDGIPGKVIEPSEDCWSSALSEFEGPNRRLGLWAKAFAEAAGNEAGAKAAYLGQRANQLHEENEARVAEAYAARLESEMQEDKRNAELNEVSVAEAYATELESEVQEAKRITELVRRWKKVTPV
jgi:hypothetical protein